MRTRVLPAGLLLLLSVALVGCASGGTTTAVQPLSASLGSTYKSVLVDVSTSVPETASDAQALENEIITELRKNASFTKVISATGAPDAKADLRLKAKIVDLRKVSAGKRVMLGGLAGRGRVKVDTDLVDGKSGKVLGSFTSEGKTSGGTVFSGTTEQALRRAAEEIAGFVAQNTGG
jgi:TolB-like protein